MVKTEKLSLDSYKRFAKGNRDLIVGCYFVFVCFWISWLVKDSVTFDAEGLYNKADSSFWYDQWIRLGRWTIYFLKKFMGITNINPYFANSIILVAFPLSALLWSFIIDRWISNDVPLLKTVFCIMYIIHPVWALQFSYRMHMEVLAIAMLFLPIAVALLTDWLEHGRKSSLAAAFVLTVLSFGAIQSFMIVYCNAMALYLMIIFEKSEKTELKTRVRDIIRLIVFSIVALAVWYLLARIVCKAKGLPYGHPYADSQFQWSDRSRKESIKVILEYIKQSMFGNGSVFTCIYGVSAIIFVVRSVIRIVRKRGCYILSFLMSLAIVFIPFILEVLTAGYIVLRSQWALVFSLSIMLAFDLLWIEETVNALKCRFSGRTISVAIMICLLLSQGQIMTRLLYTDIHTMEVDLRTFQSIYDRALDEGAGYGYAIYFSDNGKRVPSMITDSLLEEEVVGYSYIEYVYTHSHGIYDFEKPIQAMRAYGFNVAIPTQEQIDLAEETAEKMPIWPEDGSVTVLTEEKLIVVKVGR